MYGTVRIGKLQRFSTSKVATQQKIYQWRQAFPGGVQLRRRFETVSVRFYIEVKRGTYTPLLPELGSEGGQQL